MYESNQPVVGCFQVETVQIRYQPENKNIRNKYLYAHSTSLFYKRKEKHHTNTLVI